MFANMFANCLTTVYNVLIFCTTSSALQADALLLLIHYHAREVNAEKITFLHFFYTFFHILTSFGSIWQYLCSVFQK